MCRACGGPDGWLWCARPPSLAGWVKLLRARDATEGEKPFFLGVKTAGKSGAKSEWLRDVIGNFFLGGVPIELFAREIRLRGHDAGHGLREAIANGGDGLLARA